MSQSHVKRQLNKDSKNVSSWHLIYNACILCCNLVSLLNNYFLISPAECAMIFYKLYQLAGETIDWSWVAFEGLFETSDFFSFCHVSPSALAK